jgi:hypothetical protein
VSLAPEPPAKSAGAKLSEDAMKSLLNLALEAVGKTHLVEFDYRDASGLHHGRCYVRCLFSGETRVRRVFSRFGYTNIHIS